jgi:hypothetical protein
MKNKEQKLNIDKVLQTKDKAKQAEVFLSIANAPVIDLVIRYDGRTDQLAVTTIGGDIPLPAAYSLLDKAREMLHNKELEAVAQKEKPAQQEMVPEIARKEE